LALLLIRVGAGQNRVAVASSPASVTDIWGGATESIALMSDDTVWTWGWDDYGILGNGYGVTMFTSTTTYDSHIPFQVLGPGGVGHLNAIKAIAGGERHNVALDANGEVWTWGWNTWNIRKRFGTWNM
jgi:alpha-tubulin suppressor-like RCC1 family protein